jgi:two-component system, NarL family, nitrate/nitrite response regulator NarL
MTTLQNTIRALLIDDHALFRESVSEALAEPGFAIEHCGTIQEGIHLLAERHFDIVLLDHDLGIQRASLFLPAAREAGLDVRVLVVTAWISENEASRLLKQGVSGIFLKQAPLQELKEAIRITVGGGTFVDSCFAQLTSRPKGRAGQQVASSMFSDRQKQVLRFVFEGLSNKEIAWRMQISESYVKAILQALFQKTGVRTRGQLVRVALEQYGDDL